MRGRWRLHTSRRAASTPPTVHFSTLSIHWHLRLPLLLLPGYSYSIDRGVRLSVTEFGYIPPLHHFQQTLLLLHSDFLTNPLVCPLHCPTNTQHAACTHNTNALMSLSSSFVRVQLSHPHHTHITLTSHSIWWKGEMPRRCCVPGCKSDSWQC